MKPTLAVVLLLLTVAFGGYLWLRSAEPSLQGVTHTGVEAAVEIHFDQRNRPYVSASNWGDAFFAQGWLHARDRLWQMDMFRRAGKGRLAELLGQGLLPTDESIWRAGVPELAARLNTTASPELLTYVRRYVAGVNAWLKDTYSAPLEYRLLGATPALWAPEDVFAMGALMAFQSANNLDRELLRMALVDALGKQDASVFFPSPQVLPDPLGIARESWASALRKTGLARTTENNLFRAPVLGSNAWAVAKARSKSGHALFAFDSHDALSLPNLTYDVHLFVGDEQIRGTSVPGLLGVINGYNEFMAWGFTNIGDSQDVFLETRDESDPLRFKGRNGWYQAKASTVSIPVADGAHRELTLITTENGRLISDSPPLAVRWAPLEAHEFGLDALLKLNRATSFAAFNLAMDEFAAPSANVTYADTTGCVAQRTIGLLPRRGSGEGLVPLDGTDPASAWAGLIETDNMPQLASPSQGFVHAANRPFHEGAPLISADNSPGYRVRRIAEFLERDAPFMVADMKQLQTDVTNLQARRLLPRMLQGLSPELRSSDAANLLAEWQPQAADTMDSPAALLFAEWYQQFVQNLFQQRLGDELYHRLLGSSYLLNEAVDNHLLNSQEGDWPVNAALLQGFKAAVSNLKHTQAAEPADWRWGNAHQLLLKHEMSGAFPGSELLMDRGPYAARGGNATVGRARYSYGKPYNVSGGATVRMVLEMSQPVQAWMISPGGQSGHPLNPHYNDQTESWLAGRYDRIPTEPSELGSPAITLEPR